MSGIESTHRPAELLPQRLRWVPVVVFGLFVVVAYGLSSQTLICAAAAVVAVGASAGMLPPRRPLFLVYAAIAASGVAVLGHGESSNVGWFSLCLISGWCVLVGKRHEALIVWLGAILIFAVQWVWIAPDRGWASWMAGTTLTLFAVMFLRHELDLVGKLREAQAGLADRARIEERNRIARELHDVIAHTLTVSLLHVTSARLAVDHDPAGAGRSLAEAERLGRESLAEVRATVGMLHQDGSDDNAPLPGIDAIPTLVETYRAAHAEVALSIDGDTRFIPATTGLAVYRIVQESLTNALKHAAGSDTAVRLDVRDAGLELSIESSGQPTRGRGLGIISMRERAEAVGGSCEAGPSGQGWLVHASIPLDPSRRKETAT